MTRKSNYTKLPVIGICVFLLVVNGVLGTILINQSQRDLNQQMQERMLDIAKSAAALLDGDVMESLQKEDKDTPQYQKSLKILRAFQENFNLDYIYGIRNMGGGIFTFTIDPDLENPGEFGEPITYTKALYAASLGIPSFDKEPYEDRWGRFYSAYTPIFNSSGTVAGMIGVDIDADWYENQIYNHIITTLIIMLISLIAGGMLVFLITSKIHKRLVFLNSEMNDLSDEVNELATELRLASGRRYENYVQEKSVNPELLENSKRQKDDFEVLGTRLKFMRHELQKYIEDAHELAYTDALTGAGNRNAYIDTLKRLDKEISEGHADFYIAVFDINGLKNANDKYGHEFGDFLIITVSDVLKDCVGLENLFRIGGDEFVAVMENISRFEIEDIFKTVDSKILLKNETVSELKEKLPLAISKGSGKYIKGEDFFVKAVFKRADDAMYADKAAYYKLHDRRKK